VASFTQLLAEDYRGRLDTEADEYIHFVVDGANRMQQLINDLLEYSRVRTTGQPFEITDCEEVLDQVLANLRAAIEENRAVITHDPLPAIPADEGQMVQLLQNFISNAIKFRSAETPRIHVTAKPEGGEWVFSVKDNGIGIEPQFHQRIFVIFQRLHGREEYPGTGIGLAICKRVVDRHGGRIWVESEPQKGATFYFTIPVR
jgi:light-regulated signal transduction histidine kinase (bacteriophytochrome)